MTKFTLAPYEPDDFPVDDSLSDEDYYDGCEECGGRVVVTGGNGHYNGQYQCYTLYLECENCGPYEVECV